MSREAMQMALDALEIAHTGLEWYRDRCPDATDGSDDEADAQIKAAIAALQAAQSLGVADRKALDDALFKQPAAPVLTLEQIDQISNGVNGVYINGWPLSQRESRRLFAERILAAAIPEGCVVVPVAEIQALRRATTKPRPIGGFTGMSA